jgi:hypothetical protein
MQCRLLSLALAAGLAGTGSNVSAVPFSALAGDYDVYLSGATASAQFVRNSLIDRVCNPAAASGEITVYQNDLDDYTVICEVLPAVDPTAPQDIVRFIKQGGGSGDGTTPISQPAASPLLYPVPVVNPPPGCGALNPATTGLGTAFRLATGCTVPKILINGGDIGTSDVEPGLFYDVNTPSTGIAFTAADNALIDTRALAGLGFGVVATYGLRNAMQALQFPAASACHPANAVWDDLLPTMADVDGDGDLESLDVARIPAGAANPTADTSPSLGTARVRDAQECMPNITTAELAGINTARIVRWDQVHREGTTLLAAATAAGLPIPTFHATQALNNQRVHFCRRNAGSGTNAQYQVHYQRRPCAKDVAGNNVADALIQPAANTCSFTAASVFCSNEGSSDLGRCLHALENNILSGNAVEFFNNGDANPTNDTRYAWALGYQSTEVNVNLGQGFRYVKVDGLAGTIQNVYLADYTDHYEQTCQIRKDNSTIDPSASGTVVRNAFNELCITATQDIFNQNQNFLHAWGMGGWLVTPDGPGGVVTDAPLTVALVADPNTPRPINSWTRFGSSCKQATVTDPFQSTFEGDLP